MAYTYDLATDIGKVRRNIGDTSTSAAHFTDAELTSFVSDGGSVEAASGLALMAWAASLATEDELVTVGSFTGDRRDVVGKMMRLAQSYFTLVGYTATGAFYEVTALDWTPETAVARERLEVE